MNKWGILFNPKASAGKAFQSKNYIFELLKENKIEYDSYFTEYEGHGIFIVKEMIGKGIHKFISVGGDGTLNELVNGIMKSSKNSEDFLISHIPIGTGNDFGKTLGMDENIEKIIKAIKEEKYKLIDIGYLNCFNEYEKNIERYFINIAGLGYDAVVVDAINKIKRKGKGSKIYYLLLTVKKLFGYKDTKVKITVDDKEINCDLFSLCVGNGRYNGSGMMQVPKAILDDGLFDLTIINKIGKLDIIRSIKRMYNGTLLEHKKIDFIRGKKVNVKSFPKILVEADGENIGFTEANFEIIPKKLKIVVN
jgi:YegS/Rv2252/BmrU family lipid kinase